jgi:hypothetical protein
MMRVPQMKTRMIASDIISDEVRVVLYTHKNGINMLCADGSAKWVLFDHFKKQMDAIQTAGGFSVNGNTPLENLWLRLDDAP